MGQRLVASAQLDFLSRDPHILDQQPEILLPEARSRIVQPLPSASQKARTFFSEIRAFGISASRRIPAISVKNLLPPRLQLVRPLRQRGIVWREQSLFRPPRTAARWPAGSSPIRRATASGTTCCSWSVRQRSSFSSSSICRTRSSVNTLVGKGGQHHAVDGLHWRVAVSACGAPPNAVKSTCSTDIARPCPWRWSCRTANPAADQSGQEGRGGHHTRRHPIRIPRLPPFLDTLEDFLVEDRIDLC